MLIISPQIHENPATSKRIALLHWEREIDPDIQGALERGESLRTHVEGGLHDSPSGKIAWLMCAIDTQGNLERSSRGDELFWFDFVPDPESLKKQPLSLWLDLLGQQDQLLLSIQGRRHHSLMLASGEGVQQAVVRFRLAAAQWNRACDYPQAVESVRPILDRAKESGFAVLRRQFVAPVREQLLQSCASRILSELHPDLPLHKMAQAGNLGEIGLFLHDWAQNLPNPPAANAVLAEYVNDPLENIARDFFFALECYQPTNRDRAMLPVGINDSGTWAWREVPQNDLSLIWQRSRQYRALLSRYQWQRLYESNDILVGELNPMVLEALAQVKDRQQFRETRRILMAATLHQQYAVRPLSRVVLGCRGFESVLFYPVNASLCLFKIQSFTSFGWQYCLVGEVNPIEGSIRLVGQQVRDSNRDMISLLLFLVALSYRDLVVCVEERYQLSARTAQRRGKSKAESLKGATPTIWLPRFKLRQEARSTAESSKLVESIRKLVPFRIEHVRRLPEGWQASLGQIELARSLGLQVPDGYTFVRRVEGTQEEELQSAIQNYKSLSLLELFLGG